MPTSGRTWMVRSVAPASTTTGAPVAGVAVITYLVIAEAPISVGAVQFTVANSAPGLVVTPVGAPGAIVTT